MDLLLIRHGEIPSNVKKVYAGRSAEGLTPKGMAQAEEVAEKLTRLEVHAVYSSPIQRARQTAQIITEKIGIDFKIENAFREMEMGPWEGLSEADVAKNYPDEWDIWNNSPAELKLPGRETLDELLDRVLTGLQFLYYNAGPGNIVIVTHVAVIRVLLLWQAETDLNFYKTINVPNAGIFQITADSCPTP